jgi:hypothetical protein
MFVLTTVLPLVALTVSVLLTGEPLPPEQPVIAVIATAQSNTA